MTDDQREPDIVATAADADNENVREMPISEIADGNTADLAAVRDLVLRAHPDVVPELVTGATVDDLLASVEPAQDAYQRIAHSLRQHAPVPASPSVPAGGDKPVPTDPGRLPAAEKIRRGLSQNRS